MANSELYEAIKNNDVKKIEELIKGGANIHEIITVDFDNFIVNGCHFPHNAAPAITIAVAFGNPEVITMLANYGSNLDYLDDVAYFTPLHMAAFFKNLEAVQLLLSLGANPLIYTPQNVRQVLPLHVAARVGSLEIVKLLLSLHPETINASCSMPVESQETPLLSACTNLRDDKSGVYSFLLSQGANPNVKDWRGKTPLHKACSFMSGDPSIAQQILEHPNFDHNLINLPDDEGLTPLELASSFYGNPEVAALLIQHGATPIEQAEATLPNTENLQDEAAAMETTNPNPNPNPECPVCFENIFSHSNHYSSCVTCNYAICGNCSRRAANCPSCRGKLQIHPIPRQMFFPASQ